MKATIGRKPRRMVMIFHMILCMFLGLYLFEGIGEYSQILAIVVYLIAAVLLILVIEMDYLSSIKYWEIDDHQINFVFPGFRLSSIKEIPNAFIHGTLKPTTTILIQDIEAIAIDARLRVPVKEPYIHLIFCLKDGSTISMFAGDGKYHQEMIQAIQIFKEKNIQLLDPYHLVDEPEKIYQKIGEFSWEK